MPHLEGFWIKNFRILKQFAVGSCYLQFVYVDEDMSQSRYELSPTTVFIGRNGTGKSTILDAFAFIGDCIKIGVEDACLKRGGYDSIYSQDSTGPLSFGFNFRLPMEPKVLTYVVNIDFGVGHRPYVETELLAYRAETVESLEVPLLFFQNGEKIVRHFIVPDKGSSDITLLEQTDMRHLGLRVLGDLPDYSIAGMIKNFFVNHSHSIFQEIHQAFSPPSKISQRTLSSHGEGLIVLLQHFRKKYSTNFQEILSRIATKVPDIETIDIGKGQQNRWSLSVKKKNFPDPFYGHQLPEGFLKLLTYFCLLEEPDPAPLIGIDEPENGLDSYYLKLFLKEVQAAIQGGRCPQFLIATHFHGLADWMNPVDVWILEQMQDGFTQAQRGSDDLVLQDMIRNNLPLGDSWYSSVVGGQQLLANLK